MDLNCDTKTLVKKAAKVMSVVIVVSVLLVAGYLIGLWFYIIEDPFLGF